MTSFWHGKKVFITGHTGFKGSWLSLWMQELGAELCGYALQPPTEPNLFTIANIEDGMQSEIADIRDYNALFSAINTFQPDIVFHMAAQPLVRLSYEDPIDTYSTNVMGTVHLLEAVRHTDSVRAVVNITSDKCYENQEWIWGYRENEPMGGRDPYSNSKGCAELVAKAFRDSYFHADSYNEHKCGIASVRAGNVIGGGDWAADRLIPDILKAYEKTEIVNIRNPNAIRPWQHVLEPLSGYIEIAEKLYLKGMDYAEGWNFGPKEEDAKPVEWIVEKSSDLWGESAEWKIDEGPHPHEANYLKLDCSKAKSLLDWEPIWPLETTLEKIVRWHKAWLAGKDMRVVTLAEIKEYMEEKVK